MRNAPIISVITLAASLALLAGCTRDEPEEAASTAPDTSATGTPTEQAGTDAPSDVSPMKAQAWVDDVTIGHSVGADGTIPADKTGDDFAPGEAIHLAMRVEDAPPNSSVKVIWFGPNETKVGEEAKAVTPEQKHMTFAAQDTKAWAKGDYRAEVWAGDEKVNTQEFQIVDAKKAGK
jgi:hypothetical protein